MADDGMSWEAYVSEFLNADEVQQEGLWAQAEIALAVMDQFGRSNRRARAEALSKFASEVMRSASTLRKYARTAAFFPDGTRVPHLAFTHHRIAANHCPNPESAQTAIGKAAEELWSTRQLQEFLVEAYSLKAEGALEVGWANLDGSIVAVAWIDGDGLGESLAHLDGLRVRLQVKVVAEEE